jgi:hypothetical protein
MSAQHTPGPWRVSLAGRTKTRGIDILNVHELRIASCPEGTWLYRDHETREANARLIAAAPDLLAALEGLFLLLDAGSLYEPQAYAARAAIAKAKGGAQ